MLQCIIMYLLYCHCSYSAWLASGGGLQAMLAMNCVSTRVWYIAPLYIWLGGSVAVFRVGHFNICATVHTTTACVQSVMPEAAAMRGLGVLARGCAGTVLLGAQFCCDKWLPVVNILRRKLNSSACLLHRKLTRRMS